MFKYIKIIILLVSSSFVQLSCVSSPDHQQEAMLILASALTKLSASVEATVRYENSDKSLSESELLSISTKHDPSLLAPFSDYSLRVRSEDRHAIVLVCSKDGKYALLEDAGCSAKLDKHVWKSLFKSNCDFSLQINQVCAVN